MYLGFKVLSDLTDGLVEEEGFADVFDLGDCAFQVEGFGKDDLEDLGWGEYVSMVGYVRGGD
jgi:hypothetical protein